MNLFRRKSVTDLQAESLTDHSLKRALGPLNLVALGVGAIIGTGIFVLTGIAAATHAGPAVVLSFVAAGIASAFAALAGAISLVGWGTPQQTSASPPADAGTSVAQSVRDRIDSEGTASSLLMVPMPWLSLRIALVGLTSRFQPAIVPSSVEKMKRAGCEPSSRKSFVSLKTLPVGGILAVLSSDPGSAKDIPAWIQKAKHEFLGAIPEQEYTRFVARKMH